MALDLKFNYSKLCIVISEQANTLVGRHMSLDVLKWMRMRLRLQKAEFVKRFLAELDCT